MKLPTFGPCPKRLKVMNRFFFSVPCKEDQEPVSPSTRGRSGHLLWRLLLCPRRWKQRPLQQQESTCRRLATGRLWMVFTSRPWHTGGFRSNPSWAHRPRLRLRLACWALELQHLQHPLKTPGSRRWPVPTDCPFRIRQLMLMRMRPQLP